MSLSKFSPPVGSDRQINRKNGDYFNILGLPTELISHSISFLPMEDRLRVARVNKRLMVIEKESKYYVKKLLIGGAHSPNSPDSVRRIAQNTSIGSLEIDSKDILNEMMVDSFFLDLTRSCKLLEIDQCFNVTTEALHQVYKNMNDGSAKLRRLIFYELDMGYVITFLAHIGIKFRHGTFYSNREVEVYQWTDEDGSVCSTIIFDEYIEIVVDCISQGELTYLDIEFHETRQSLEKEKNIKGLVRVEIYPE